MKVAIIGAAGYTGGELLRLLVNHPRVSQITAVSRSQSGKAVSSVHEDLFDSDLIFSSDMTPSDLTFLCGEHGETRKLREDYNLDENSPRLIDLANDHRDGSEGFVYGLSEVYGERIAGATKVANPGCFATAIQLGLAPLASEGMLKDTIHVTAITGSTGAGQKLQKSSHFSNRQQNVSAYKIFEHQHLAEIHRTLSELAGQKCPKISFVPIRGPFTRGIIASIVLPTDRSEDELLAKFQDFYSGHRGTFVHATRDEVGLKSVINTNHVRIQITVRDGEANIVVCLDNLLKGASGSAVQNMNLMFAWPIDTGLRLKPLAY